MKIGLAGYSGSGVTTFLALLSEDPELVTRHGRPEIRSITVDDPRLDRQVKLFKPKKISPLQEEVIELGDLRPQEGGACGRRPWPVPPAWTPWFWFYAVLTLPCQRCAVKLRSF